MCSTFPILIIDTQCGQLSAPIIGKKLKIKLFNLIPDEYIIESKTVQLYSFYENRLCINTSQNTKFLLSGWAKNSEIVFLIKVYVDSP